MEDEYNQKMDAADANALAGLTALQKKVERLT